MTSPVAFSLSYMVSWLLMGLGVFLTFRFATHLRHGARAKARGVGHSTAVTTPLVTVALVLVVVLASLGVFYAGAYTFYTLVIVP